MRRLLIGFTLLSLTLVAQGQSTWWIPATPLIGQPVEIFYDVTLGTLPDDAQNVRMHWGVYDPETTFWMTPPEEMWPPGTELQGAGPAVQTPMNEEGAGVFSLLLEPPVEVIAIAFVFTDGTNWDNNSEQNWIILFISDEIAAWWTPEEPQTGEPLTIFYNPVPGVLPDNPTQVLLHWGVNEFGHGNWITPPVEMWPPGTVDQGDGHAVQTPMVATGDIYQLTITPNDTIHHLHFVITDGTTWDTNDGLNWDIAIGDAPEYREVQHRFVFDPRSVFYAGMGQPITQVNLAGEFNGWNMSSDPLQGPDEQGVWQLDYQLLEGVYDYKFVVNGNEWSWDPDNPLINESDNNNSQAVISASLQPCLRDPSHPPGTVLPTPETLDFAVTLAPNDYNAPLVDISVELDDQALPFDYDPEQQLLTCSPALTSFGRYLLEITAVDSAANTVTGYYPLGVNDPASGLLLLDAVEDEQYEYPTPPGNYADLIALTLTEGGGGDSIRFEAELELLHNYSRLCLQISPSLLALAAGQPVSLELNSRDWQSNGVFTTICNPAAPQYEPGFHNQLFVSRDPLEVLVPLEVTADGNSFVFAVAVADLEGVMGSYSWEWYFSLYSYLGGVAPVQGHAYEVGAAQGGSDHPLDPDPDVYDLLGVDTAWLQQRLLNNWFESRTATLDATGRGFRAVLPEEIGPGIASPGPRVQILTQGAPTILVQQQLSGTVSSNAVNPVTIYINSDSLQTVAVDDTFSVEINLQDGVNLIQAMARDGEGYAGYSAQISYDLLINHAPVPLANVVVEGETVTLSGAGTSDVDDDITGWLWVAAEDNPATIVIQNADQSEATLASVPAVDGEYYLRLTVTDGEDNSGWARTFFTVADAEVIPTAVNRAPAWIGDAIVYEIYPRSFTQSGDLAGITAALDYIADLGVNTIWLMPIFEGPSSHGYEITDYFNIESDYGTMADFDELVTAVHDRNMRILLDMVINHSGIGHPWMQDCFQYGEYSHYWDYYDRDANGNYTYYYDWASLPNLNVSNPELEWALAEMSLFWLDEHEVDGFRYDVAWGPQQRNSQFWVVYREYLKRQFPDILMLAEANVSDFTYLNDRFDSAYDWSLHHDGAGCFANLYNGTPDIESLHTLITNYGVAYPDYAWPFRFMENHDESRYLSNHNAAQTRQVASILLTIPGLPLIYAGQEVGELTPRNLINWNDPQNMLPWYDRLIKSRRDFSSVRSRNFGRLNNDDMAHTYSYYRRNTENTVLAFHNLENSDKTVEFQIPSTNWGYHQDSSYFVNDMVNLEAWPILGSDLANLPLPFTPWQSRICVISDSNLVEAVTPDVTPGRFALQPVYPNPFNPSTTISFELPQTGPVSLIIYNVLGQRTEQLIDHTLAAGVYTMVWQADRYAAGLYFCRLQQGEQQAVRKMMLVK